MKKLLIHLLIVCFLFSCKKDEDSAKFDFTISGIETIETFVEETKTIELLIKGNGITPDSIHLQLENVPEGITYKFDITDDIPEFGSTLEIKISRNVAGGKHVLKLIASSVSVSKEFPIEVNVDKSLSAAFTVYNSTNFDLQDYNSNLLDSATIKLYKNESAFIAGLPDYKLITNSSGKAYFYKIPEGNYLFTIEKGSLSNVVQKRNVNGVLKGFIVAGMFRTKQEISNSAQPNALPGDLKLRDLNADGKIDTNDLSQYDSFSVYEGDVNEKVIWVGP